MWSGPKTGVQGVTELAQCERTQDVWLQRIQDEFRVGKLSEDTHAFLHGRPIIQPGIYDKQIVRCGQKRCIARSYKAYIREKFMDEDSRTQFARETLAMECKTCKAHRESKRLVATDKNDPRFKEDKFSRASSILSQ